MIVYKKIEPQLVNIYDKDGFFATVNEYEFNDIRLQIKKEKVKDFYVLFKDKRYYIDTDGKIDFPSGMFDLIMDQLMELF